ncbi:MAG: hypothetical protein IJ737_06375 [Ruminococcus sp.]|nr:hypothetical protein [Ruminococcus sp.]
MSDQEKELKKLEQEVKASGIGSSGVPQPKSVKMDDSDRNDLLEFFIGILLLGGGIYWVLNSFEVYSTWGYGYYSFFGTGLRVTGGVMLIPLLVGIGLIFFLDGKKRIIGYTVASLGILVILISLLSSVHFHAKPASLYIYVLMFGMIAAGAGLLIRALFRKRD